MKTGRYNVGVGLLVMAGFMLYGFLLIYLRDFAPDKEAWVASYSVGKHFEARLAHVHGNLFALLNLALGFVLVRLAAASDRARTAAAGLGLAGLLMPAGILGEVYLGLSPIFVLLGAVAMTASVVLTGLFRTCRRGRARRPRHDYPRRRADRHFQFRRERRTADHRAAGQAPGRQADRHHRQRGLVAGAGSQHPFGRPTHSA